MSKPLLLSPLAVVLFASAANAATLYVSPTGTETAGCTRAAPCDLASGAGLSAPGDTVILTDGIYQASLVAPNSGTAGAWITFKADECATPIIEGPGAGPNDDDQSGGVGSSTAEYIRFDGIVARGWNIGFGNGWAGGTASDAGSNGHWEILNCISYSNGRTGFTFFSAQGLHLKNSISAHNGSSVLQSWSSGVALFEAGGTGNLVESVISFENTDAQQHTDGSGFIVDEQSNGVTLINNLAFGNAGSCLRLTKSSNTRFINNTCYHDSQFGTRATGPSNPGEIYFTNGGVTQQGVTFMNNVIVGTGQAPAGSQPIINQPPTGWTNNVVTTGTPAFFTDPVGTNPSFVPATSATNLIGAGSNANGAPTSDIGLDPKCIVKRTPVMVGSVARETWWQYDVDIDYVKSIGGVAKCFNAAARSGTPDIGAYKAGRVTSVTPGSCVPPPPPPEPTGATSDAGGTGGTETAREGEWMGAAPAVRGAAGPLALRARTAVHRLAGELRAAAGQVAATALPEARTRKLQAAGGQVAAETVPERRTPVFRRAAAREGRSVACPDRAAAQRHAIQEVLVASPSDPIAARSSRPASCASAFFCFGAGVARGDRCRSRARIFSTDVRLPVVAMHAPRENWWHWMQSLNQAFYHRCSAPE